MEARTKQSMNIHSIQGGDRFLRKLKSPLEAADVEFVSIQKKQK